VKPPAARLRIAVELALMFAILHALDGWSGGAGFAGFNPNPYWLPVVAASLAYGAGPGLAAALAASTFWLAATYRPLGLSEDPFDHLIALTLPPVMWVAGSVLIGEVTGVRLKRLDRTRARGALLDRNVRLLIDRYRKLARVNRELQVNIAASDRGVSAALAAAIGLVGADPIAYARIVVQLIALAADSKDFTLYIVDPAGSHRFVAGAEAGPSSEQLPAPLLAAVTADPRLHHIGDPRDRILLGPVGAVALPLSRPKGGLIGVLILHELSLERFTFASMATLTDVATWLTPLLELGLPALRVEEPPARLRLTPVEGVS
jgi:hypothetical protein